LRFLKAIGFEQSAADASEIVMARPAGAALLGSAKAQLKESVRAFAIQEEKRRAAKDAAEADKLAQLRQLSKQNGAKRTAEAEQERQRLLKGIQIDHEDKARQADMTNFK
jgi:predicted ATPase|tara:strand:+ start:532 stop:861 length:330 start_codon:yes stop_codon:yes gene_type:complete